MHVHALHPAIAPVSSIRLLTMNVFCRPPFVSNHGNDYKDERLAIIAERVKGFDIVCFQELFGSFSSRRHGMLQTLGDAGFKFHALAPPPRLQRGQLVDGGVVVLSKLPIVEHEFVTLERGCHSDSLAAKGALFVRVETGREDTPTVLVVCTHLQATYKDPERRRESTAKSQRVRRNQISQLAAAVRRLKKVNEAVIIAGDFNVNGRKGPTDASDSYEYEDLMTWLWGAGAFRDPLREFHGEQPVTFCDVDENGAPLDTVLAAGYDWGERSRLDYVFFWPNGTRVTCSACDVDRMAVVGQPFRILSDHFAVTASFDLLAEEARDSTGP